MSERASIRQSNFFSWNIKRYTLEWKTKVFGSMCFNWQSPWPSETSIWRKNLRLDVSKKTPLSNVRKISIRSRKEPNLIIASIEFGWCKQRLDYKISFLWNRTVEKVDMTPTCDDQQKKMSLLCQIKLFLWKNDKPVENNILFQHRIEKARNKRYFEWAGTIALSTCP